MEFYILFSFNFLWLLIQTTRISFIKKDNILLAKEYKQLSENYDKLCNILAGEIDVEDVKKKLEGKVEQKALPEFPLTINQVNVLRKIAQETEKGTYLPWKRIKNATLQYSLISLKNTKATYLVFNNNFWAILDSAGHSILRKWGALGEDEEFSIVLDPLQVQEILKNNE